MKNITLAIDEKILDEVRVYAAKRNTSVNGLVRGFLEGIAAQEDQTARARRELLKMMETSAGRMGPDWTWNREETHER